MEKLNEQQKKPFSGHARIAAVARGDSGTRILGRKFYTAPNRDEAMIIAEGIIFRDNAARLKNIAGQFVITELVMG